MGKHKTFEIKIRLTAREHRALTKLARRAFDSEGNEFVTQTPDDLARDVVLMYIVKEQAKERP